jgi:hypothetical protein
MATYVKAENIEIFVDRKNCPQAVLRNTLTKEMREFTNETDVKIIDFLESDTLSCNGSSVWETYFSVEDIAARLHISNSYVFNILFPLFKAGFLIDVSDKYELYD